MSRSLGRRSQELDGEGGRRFIEEREKPGSILVSPPRVLAAPPKIYGT